MAQRLNAEIQALTVALRLWSEGEHPIKTFTRVWLHSRKVLERRRMTLEPGSDSSFIRNFARQHTLKLLWESLESMIEVLQSVLQVIRTRPSIIDEALLRYIKAHGPFGGADRIHAVALKLLTAKPSAEAKNLALLLEIETAELYLVKERLRDLSSKDYSYFAVWSYFVEAAEFAMRKECSWIHALDNSHVCSVRDKYQHVKKDVWTLTGLVDPDEVQEDDIRKAKASSTKSGSSKEHQKLLKTLAAQMGNGVSKKLAEAQGDFKAVTPSPPKNQNVGALRTQFKDLVAQKKPSRAADAAKICAFFAHGLKCKDFDSSKSNTSCKAKKRQAQARSHVCLCGGTGHAVTTCTKWFG